LTLLTTATSKSWAKELLPQHNRLPDNLHIVIQKSGLVVDAIAVLSHADARKWTQICTQAVPFIGLVMKCSKSFRQKSA